MVHECYSTTRFILYTSSLVYLIKRDVKVFIFAAMVIGVLFAMYKTNVISPGNSFRPTNISAENNSCQLPFGLQISYILIREVEGWLRL